ncbi:membrane-associated guanylate kinase, WW and PDZ domain-containing protein 3 isoform X2 [Eurosta solidaginis]
MFRNANRDKNNIISNSHLPTRLCHIVKRPDFEGYGFSLHSEKVKPGQYIGYVDTNSPAEAAGLKEGDRIIEVNGVYIIHESHKQVVQRIKSISHEVRLLIEEIIGSNTNKRSDNKILGSRAMKTSRIKFDNGSNDIIDISIGIPVSIKTNTNSSKNIQQLSEEEKGNIIDLQYEKNPTHYHNSDESKQFSNISTTTGPSQLSTRTLELPMTAAEMRYKLLLKKKYDPKNEVVDLKTKYEIIQKL